jgi:hypothetical protein
MVASHHLAKYRNVGLHVLTTQHELIGGSARVSYAGGVLF